MNFLTDSHNTLNIILSSFNYILLKLTLFVYMYVTVSQQKEIKEI